MNGLLEQHDGHCWCRACKPPLTPIGRDDRQATDAAMIGAALLVTIVGTVGGVAFGFLALR